MRTATKIKSLAGLAAAIIALTLIAFNTHTTPHTTAAPTEPPAVHTTAPTPQDPTGTAALAAALPLIVDEAALPPYSRDTFGAAWADIDGNGCRQRDDLLARDLVDVELASNGCTVLRGVLEVDPYTGERIVFQHDRVAESGNPGSQGVQGEHIISLKAAHDGGAWAWSDEQRLQFANDLDNVIAVDGTANQEKQDAGPAEWLPQTAYLCTYVEKYTQIASTWHLAVTTADRDALVRTLTECEAER